MYSNRQSGAARYQTIVDPSDIDPASTSASLAWQEAVHAERSGDLLHSAARYLACPPLPGRGTAAARFHAAWCYERAGHLLKASQHYEFSINESSDAALTIEAAFRLAWLAIDARDNARAMPRLAQVIELAGRTCGLRPRTAACCVFR